MTADWNTGEPATVWHAHTNGWPVNRNDECFDCPGAILGAPEPEGRASERADQG